MNTAKKVDVFAIVANALIDFGKGWQVDNEVDLDEDDTFMAEGTKAINQVIGNGYIPDLNFIRRLIETTGIKGFSEDGPWMPNDQEAYERFCAHWIGRAHEAPAQTPGMTY